MWPNDVLSVGQHWLRYWLSGWRHKATAWINVAGSSGRSSNINPGAISQDTSAIKHQLYIENYLPAISSSSGQCVDTNMHDVEVTASLGCLGFACNCPTVGIRHLFKPNMGGGTGPETLLLFPYNIFLIGRCLWQVDYVLLGKRLCNEKGS